MRAAERLSGHTAADVACGPCRRKIGSRTVFVVSMVTAAVLMMVMSSLSEATFSGRNGDLLVRTNGEDVFSPGKPLASLAQRSIPRQTDCGSPDDGSKLWSIRPDGTHLARLGQRGDLAWFSPQGFRLAIDYFGSPYYPCYSRIDPAAGLYLSRGNGSHSRRLIGDGIVGWLPDGRLLV